MKFNKPTSKKAANSAAMVAGATVGAMVSDAVASVIPLKNPLYSRLAVLGLGVAGLLTIQGNDVASESVKGAFAGMAIQQAVKTSRESLTKVLPASAKSNSFVAAALGEAQALASTETPVARPHLGVPIRNRAGMQFGMQPLGTAPSNIAISPSKVLG